MNDKSNYKRIEAACNNFKRISDDVKNQKFYNVDIWLCNVSKKFVKENDGDERYRYYKFKYGTIISVDFGIREGSEISKPHFAITLDKNDNIKNPVITVLPLTSKNKGHNIYLGRVIEEAYKKKLEKQYDDIIFQIKTLKIDSKESIDEIDKLEKQKEIIKHMIRDFQVYFKDTYVCINQITTISKDKIKISNNKFDIINKVRCDDGVMQIISDEIIKKYTNSINTNLNTYECYFNFI